jgi:hypothetical protein
MYCELIETATNITTLLQPMKFRKHKIIAILFFLSSVNNKIIKQKETFVGVRERREL